MLTTSCFSKKKKKKKKKKKRSRSDDFGSDEYSYSIFYSDPRISEYSDTHSSPNSDDIHLNSLGIFSINVITTFHRFLLLALRLYTHVKLYKVNLRHVSYIGLWQAKINIPSVQSRWGGWPLFLSNGPLLAC